MITLWTLTALAASYSLLIRLASSDMRDKWEVVVTGGGCHDKREEEMTALQYSRGWDARLNP
jgi:hypothetical protein